MKTSNRTFCIRGLAAASLIVNLGACSSGPSNQISTPASAANRLRPICLPGGQDSDTANVLMLDTLFEAKQDSLFAAMQRAAAGGELYKALLYSRVLTGRSDATPEAWEARARIAGALDFPYEAERARAHASAQGAGNRTKPVEEPLPSARLASKAPASLADWAASLEIIAGSDSAWGRPRAVVAIRDDVSGISAEGVGEPVQADHVLPNIFVLTDGSTFREKGPSGMGIALVALGALSAGLGGYSGSMAAVEQGQIVAGAGAGELSATKTVLTGGSFKRGLWKDERFETRSDKGKPSGERLAVGYPLVMPTASGQPFSETVPMRLIENGTKTAKMRVGSDPKPTDVSSVLVTRLLPSGASSLEAIVTADELSDLVPTLEPSRLAAFQVRSSLVTGAADRYRADPSGVRILSPRYAARVADGRCIDVVISESRWLVPEK